MKLRTVTNSELPLVTCLYREAIGWPGCTWNENYPGDFELNMDYSGGNLYVLAEGDRILGAVSVVAEQELTDLCSWKEYRSAEIARVVVDSRYSGRGLARQMLTELFVLLKEQGVRSIHLSVACCNTAAVRLYRSLGFSFLGQVFLYGGEFYLCEKIL